MARKKDIPPQDTRDALVQAAYEVFLKHGYHGTSMRDIAARAKLSVAAAYNHFKNKDDLFVAVLRRHHPYGRILPALAEVRGDTVEELLRQAARKIVRLMGREPGFLRLMLIEIVEFDSRHLSAMFADLIPRLVEFTRSLEHRKGKLRSIRPQVLIRSFGGLFISYYVSEIMLWKFLPRSMQTDCLDDFIDIYLHGVLAPTPSGAK